MQHNELQEMQERALAAARMLLMLLDTDDLAALLHEYDRMDAVMPMIDPAAYKRHHNISGYRRVVVALAAAHAAIVAERAGETRQ